MTARRCRSDSLRHDAAYRIPTTAACVANSPHKNKRRKFGLFSTTDDEATEVASSESYTFTVRSEDSLIMLWPSS